MLRKTRGCLELRGVVPQSSRSTLGLSRTDQGASFWGMNMKSRGTFLYKAGVSGWHINVYYVMEDLMSGTECMESFADEIHVLMYAGTLHWQ
jgi:hypothetical protein